MTQVADANIEKEDRWWRRTLLPLATTGRLWWHCWPQLVLLVLFRNLLGSYLIDGAVAVGIRNHVLGLCALSLPVLVDLLLIVAMFHVLKPWLPVVGRLETIPAIEPPRQAGRESFVH